MFVDIMVGSDQRLVRGERTHVDPRTGSTFTFPDDREVTDDHVRYHFYWGRDCVECPWGCDCPIGGQYDHRLLARDLARQIGLVAGLSSEEVMFLERAVEKIRAANRPLTEVKGRFER